MRKGEDLIRTIYCERQRRDEEAEEKQAAAGIGEIVRRSIHGAVEQPNGNRYY